jgi:hypothetical protein
MSANKPGFAETRRSLHGVAELILAGPQYAACQEISLKVTPDGFGTTHSPDIRVVGVEIITEDSRAPIDGLTPRRIGEALGIEPRGLAEVYQDGSGVELDDLLAVEAEAARVLAQAYAVGDAALRTFAPEQTPILWPGHFDLGVSADEVNYGVSPGDDHVAEPYAYVGPWTPPEQDEFWNASFGAARPLSELPDADAVAAFFDEGRSRLRR